MDARTNFIVTMRDLGRIAVIPPKWAEVWRSTVNLRRLLFDGQPLVHQVNREHRLDIKFRAGLHYGLRRERAGTVIAAVGDGFDPDSAITKALKAPVTEVDLKGLLRLEVVQLGADTMVTVQELIEHVGYVQGAVHAGDPKTPKDEVLLTWRHALVFGRPGLGLREVAAVGRVVHRGLMPLYQAAGGPA